MIPLTAAFLIATICAGPAPEMDRRKVGPIEAAQYVRIDHVGAEDKPISSLILVTRQRDAPKRDPLDVHYFVVSEAGFLQAVNYIEQASTGAPRGEKILPSFGTFVIAWRNGKANGNYVVASDRACVYLRALKGSVAKKISSALTAALQETLERLGCSGE